MNQKLSILILFVFVLLVVSCSSETKSDTNESLKTGKIFYNEPESVLWRHQVNSIEKLKHYSKVFKGIEFDAVYYMERNEFEVEHDPDPNSKVLLTDYLNSIAPIDSIYFWMDLKNLTIENADSMKNCLLSVFNQFGIKERVICESHHDVPLKTLHEGGIKTSYWIPHFPYSSDQGKLEPYQQDHLNKVNEILKDCPHNAISASYEMFPFINDYLSDCTTHLWTNGLITEDDKTKIREFASHTYVKVILIDYEKPF